MARSNKVRKRKSRKAKVAERQPKWTKFVRIEAKDMVSNLGNTELMQASLKDTLIFANNRYQVIIRTSVTPVGPLIQMAINAHDYSTRHDWRELQRIKNELLGVEIEAVEIYPAESRLVDTSNQYYLYALPPTKDDNGRIVCPKWPFGFRDRLISEYNYKGPNKQRAWHKDERPADITEISETMIAEHLAKLLKARQEQTIDDIEGCQFCKTEEEPAKARPCDECGCLIPEIQGGHLYNKHHDVACSLYYLGNP